MGGGRANGGSTTCGPSRPTPTSGFWRSPWLVVVFAMKKTDDGGQVYYLNESVGIATGMLLSAAHHAGLATLTHTPSPMKFLGDVLGRPDNERAFLLIPMGYPTEDCVVPVLERKGLGEIGVFVE